MNPEIFGKDKKVSLGRAAMLLAMTEDREEEEVLRNWLKSKGLNKTVVTEASGPLAEFKQKIMKNAATAALNTGIITNDPKQLHGVVHAVLEATQGILIASLANPSIKIKMSIVSDGEWVAVGAFGVTALHVATNHERAGLGIMHI